MVPSTGLLLDCLYILWHKISPVVHGVVHRTNLSYRLGLQSIHHESYVRHFKVSMIFGCYLFERYHLEVYCVTNVPECTK